MIASSYDQNDLIFKTNTELSKVVTWLRANKLCLNVNKTKCINFRSKTSRCNTIPQVQLDGQIIDYVDSHNFLGIHVDCHLKWNTHIEHVCNKISKTIGILHKLKYTLPQNILILLYNALILPYLTYGNVVWGSACKTQLTSVFKKQKQAVRVCTLSNYLAHSSPIFYSLNTLNIFYINKYLICIFMYRYVNNTIPISFKDMFQYNSDVHSHFTRNSMQFRPKKLHSSLDVKSLRFTGPKLFNTIDDSIKNISSFTGFKRKMKQNFINHYNVSN